MPGDSEGDDGHGAVARDVELGQRSREVGAPVGDGGGTRGVGAGVVRHHPADVLEVSVAAVPPAGIFDDFDALGTENVARQTGSPVHGPVCGTVHLHRGSAGRYGAAPKLLLSCPSLASLADTHRRAKPLAWRNRLPCNMFAHTAWSSTVRRSANDRDRRDGCPARLVCPESPGLRQIS